MKANELMIGDWVHVEAHRGFNAQNVKVETIPDNDGDYKYGHHYGHIGTWLDGGDNDFRDVEAKHLQPIPLTPEILEKNGFTRHSYGFSFQYFKLYGNLRNDDTVYFTITINKEDIMNDYIHQLQHAMRICGIEKEIVL